MTIRYDERPSPRDTDARGVKPVTVILKPDELREAVHAWFLKRGMDVDPKTIRVEADEDDCDGWVQAEYRKSAEAEPSATVKLGG